MQQNYERAFQFKKKVEGLRNSPFSVFRKKPKFVVLQSTLGSYFLYIDILSKEREVA